MGQFRSNANAATLALIALLTLGLGIFSPFMMMTVPLMGVHNTYSLIGGIVEFFHSGGSGNYFLGIILLTFSVLFPTAKLLLLLTATSRFAPISKTTRIRIHRWVGLTAKYSMLDLMVIAIMIVIFKAGNLVSVASVAGLSGIYIFSGAILLSMMAELMVDFMAFERADNGN